MAEIVRFPSLSPRQAPTDDRVSQHRVAFVVFPAFRTLDLTGPREVFAMAGHRRLETVSVNGGPVLASSGLTIGPTTSVADADFGVDTLIAVGGPGQRAACGDERLMAWFSAAARSRRVASVCSGAFMLAKAGLLDGRRRSPTGARATSWLAGSRP
jgi:transcriptional regulator GlxA family with amidase domain